LTDQEKEALHKLVAKHKTSQAIALRARIILQFYGGIPLNAIATALGVVYKTVLKWTERWKEHSEMAVEKRLEETVLAQVAQTNSAQNRSVKS